MKARTIALVAASLWFIAPNTSSEEAKSSSPKQQWQNIEPSAIGWNNKRLGEALAYAQQQNSSGVVVTHKGKILAQGHWSVSGSMIYKLFSGDTNSAGQNIEDVASMQKSLVAILIAIAESKKLIETQAPVSQYLGKGWSDATPAQESKITVHHLLSMSSGLDPSLSYTNASGSDWQYNTNAYSQLVPILEKVTQSTVQDLSLKWLTGPLNMRDSSWERRYWVLPGMDANQYGFKSSALDMARLGKLMLSLGVHEQKQLVAEESLAKMSQPSQHLNPSYGYLWWLNGQSVKTQTGRSSAGLVPSAPSDMYMALGLLGRKLYVVPSLELVVTRLGDKPDDDFDEVFWRKLMAASPTGNVCGECNGAVSDQLTKTKASNDQFISWQEHIIDDPTLGIEDLSGSDGLSGADLDNDGFEDIVSVHESDTEYDGKAIGHVRIAWGSASSDSWQLSTLASGVEAAAAEDVSIADVNGDGYLDVVVACELAHLIYFQNPGHRQTSIDGEIFDPRTTQWRRTIISVSQNRGSYIRAFLADFNGDGTPEIVAANKGEQNPEIKDAPLNNISLYVSPNDPLKGSQWTEIILGQVKIPINSEPVDLDGDGDLDIVAGSRGESRVLWFENQGDYTFVEHAISLPETAKGLAVTGFNMDYADMNGDGRTDIVSTAWPGVVTLLLQPEDPADQWQFSVIGNATPDQLVSVRLGDIDGDSDLDIFVGAYSRGPRDKDGALVTANNSIGRIAWFENPGEQQLDSWPRHDISRRKRGMYDKWLMRDLDADGDLDLIGTRGNSEPYDGVFWLEQVRTEQPRQVFTQARPNDSLQMSLPSP